MFGILRYFLSLCVLATHLYGPTPDGLAAYAVWGFYCLSGYLMALVLDTKYPPTARGLKDFAIARTLRLLPAYYAVCVGVMFLYGFLPETAARYHPFLKFPSGRWAWFIALVPVWPDTEPGLIPQFYAVRIELVFYAMMALGLARGRLISLAWLLVSLVLAVSMMADGASFWDRFSLLRGCSLPFSLGAVLYHYRDRLPIVETPWKAMAMALGALVAHFAILHRFPSQVFEVGLYTGLVASAFAVVVLRGACPERAPAWLVRCDQLGGDLSYPLYLCHWAIGAAVSALLDGRGRWSKGQFVVSFLVAHLAAWLLHRYVETPADRVRKRLISRPWARKAESPVVELSVS